MEQDENDCFIVSLDEDLSDDDFRKSLSGKAKKPKASEKQPKKKKEATKRSRGKFQMVSMFNCIRTLQG